MRGSWYHLEVVRSRRNDMIEMRVVALISGGKDSCYNLMRCVATGHEVVALANLQPAEKVDELDSFMFQTVGHDGVHLYAEALGLPLYRITTDGVSVTREMTYDPKKGDEVEDLYDLLKKVKQEVVGGVEGVASGAILSDYQRIRVENVCSRLGLVSLAYLWRRDQRELLKEMIEAKVEAVVIKVAAMGLTERHLGMTIEELYPELCSLNQQFGLNICGEGGEYETFTLDCPLFKKKILLEKSEVVMHSEDRFAPVALLRLCKLRLQEKVSVEHDERIQDKHIQGASLLAGPRPPSEEACVQSLLRRDCQTQCLSPSPSCTWMARDGDPAHPSVVGQASALMTAVGADLAGKGHGWQDVVLVYLYLSDMVHYAAANEVYGQCFPVEPPARVCVCVTLPAGVLVRVEMLVCTIKEADEEGVVTRGRSSMHVQSVSEWAPANIGPYSQAYTVDGVVFGAGQIGLDPAHMSLVPPMEQASLSLAHVQSVLKACHASLTSALCGVCYYTTEEAGWSAKIALKECEASNCLGGRVDCPVRFVRIRSLPRGAYVEWHFMACPSSVDVSYSLHHDYKDDIGVVTLQESWCGGLGVGSWLALTTAPSMFTHTRHDPGEHLSTCFQYLHSQLSKHGLLLGEMAMVCVSVPRHGAGLTLDYTEVQAMADSVTGCVDGKVPISLLSTEDYWEQNGGVSVHALRIS